MTNYGRALMSLAFVLFSVQAEFVHAQLSPVSGATWTGRYSISVDGNGTLTGSGKIKVQKPAQATVKAAYLAAAALWAKSLPNGAISLAGRPIRWSKTFRGAGNTENGWADVTAIVAPIVNAASPGIVEISVTEKNTLDIDGVRFSPSAAGEKRDTLNIKSNDPASPDLRLPLMGAGISPIPAFAWKWGIWGFLALLVILAFLSLLRRRLRSRSQRDRITLTEFQALSGLASGHAENSKKELSYLNRRSLGIQMIIRSHSIFSLIVLLSVFSSGNVLLQRQESRWQQIDEGLFIAEFEASQKSIVGDSKIQVVKIDPRIYSFKLLCAGQLNQPNLTAKEWCQKYELIAAINAGMFQTDHTSNVGYMKNFDYVNQPQVSSKYHSVAAFNPLDQTQPPFRIFDVDDNDIKLIIGSYRTVIQNLRLIKRPGKNQWAQQNRRWSEAALGQDENGNVLFIFSRSPYSMHDLNDILLSLPINLVCAQHLEGGPEASLYFSHKGTVLEAFGSYETGFNESNNNTTYWPIPNVIGFVKRSNY